MLLEFDRAVHSLDEATARNPLPGTEDSATASTNLRTRTRVAAPGMPGSGGLGDSEARQARQAVGDRVHAGRVAQLEDQLRRAAAAQAKAERERDDAQSRFKAEREERKAVKHQYAAERKEMRRRLAQAERAVAAAQQERERAEQRLAQALEALVVSEQAAASAMRTAESAVAGMTGARAEADDVAQEQNFAQAVGGGLESPRTTASPPPRPGAAKVADFADYARRRGRWAHADDPAQMRAPRLLSVPRPNRDEIADAAQQARKTASDAAAAISRLCLALTALASLSGLWGTFGDRLPAKVASHFLLGHSLTVASTTVAICALAGAALCRALLSVLAGEERGLAAGICLGAGIAALWVGHGAHLHHTSPQWLAPGQWYLVGVLLLLLSLLTRTSEVGRRVREMALGAGLAVALTATIPQATLLRGLLVLGAVLVVVSLVRYVGRSLKRADVA